MIQYNVTINIENDILEEWMQWMRTEHIPSVMKTGIFVSYRIAEMLAPIDPEQEGSTFSFQYFCKTIEDYNRYEKEFAPALRAETTAKYGNKIVAFRSIMQIWEEGSAQ